MMGSTAWAQEWDVFEVALPRGRHRPTVGYTERFRAGQKYYSFIVFSKREEHTVGRPRGSKNRSSRELEAAGKALIKEAKLKKKIEALKQQSKK